tara:strand:+ start:549 stop:1322 length:774 start_codon:yes stop_codon:yes gene_type:complete
MTMITNNYSLQCGFATTGIIGWTYGKTRDFREYGRELDKQQKDFFNPLLGGTGQFLGGVGDMTKEGIDATDATPLVDKDAFKDLGKGLMGDGMWGGAFNAAVDTLPATVGDTPWQDVVVGGGLETMGDYVKDVGEGLANAAGGSLADSLGDKYDDSTPDYTYAKFGGGRRDGAFYADAMVGVAWGVPIWKEEGYCAMMEAFLEVHGGYVQGRGFDTGGRYGGRLTAGPNSGGGVFVDVSQPFGDDQWQVGYGVGSNF